MTSVKIKHIPQKVVFVNFSDIFLKYLQSNRNIAATKDLEAAGDLLSAGKGFEGKSGRVKYLSV